MSPSQPMSNSTQEVPSKMSGRTWAHGFCRIARWHVAAIALLTVCVSLATTGSVVAQEPGTTQPSIATKLNPMNWKMPAFHMPEFLVPKNDQERIVERKDTLVSDIKTTTSQSWQRTKTTFSPARLNPMNLFSGSTTQPGHQTKPGFFSSLFSPAESKPEARVATVNEFLNQDRP